MPARNGYSDTTVAIVCHEANRGLQLAQRYRGNEQQVIPGGLIDLHPDLLAAAIEGVRAIRSGQTTNPANHHNHWVAFLTDRGWQRGPREPHRDAKTHPNLVDWAELEPGERDKDRVLFGIVLSLTLDVEG